MTPTPVDSDRDHHMKILRQWGTMTPMWAADYIEKLEASLTDTGEQDLGADWAARFAQTANDLKAQGPSEGVHPLLHKAQIDACESMAGELKADDTGCPPHCCCCGPGEPCCDCGEVMPSLPLGINLDSPETFDTIWDALMNSMDTEWNADIGAKAVVAALKEMQSPSKGEKA